MTPGASASSDSRRVPVDMSGTDADQTRQDPTEVHEQPDTEGEQLPSPGDEGSVTAR